MLNSFIQLVQFNIQKVLTVHNWLQLPTHYSQLYISDIVVI